MHTNLTSALHAPPVLRSSTAEGGRSTLYALSAFCILLSAFASLAQSVTTDAPDYPPGSTVYITGGGFAPGETVTCQVLHDPTGVTTPPARSPTLDRHRR